MMVRPTRNKMGGIMEGRLHRVVIIVLGILIIVLSAHLVMNVMNQDFFRTADAVRLSLIILLILLLCSISISIRRSYHMSLLEWFGDFLSEIKSELFGAVILTFLFSVFVGNVEQTQKETNLKTDLIRQLGSRVHDTTIFAAEELRNHGRGLPWIEDGTLVSAYLWEANLSEVNFYFANLQKAILGSANLQGADLSAACLIETNFKGADLKGATLHRSNLRGANFEDAVLFGADFSQAYLEDTVFSPPQLLENQFDGSTILPDGTTWVLGTDMSIYTDPDNPNFFRTSDAYSRINQNNGCI